MKFVARFSLLLLLVVASVSSAHDARPNYVQVTETTPNTYSVMWKVPASLPGAVLPYPIFPEGCVAERQAAWREAGAEYMGQQVFACDAGLSGRKVGIRFPDINPSLSTLYKVRVEHIWAGIDHLLFVACLLFVARTPRRLLITITGFTVAHSITLALSTLDVVRIATPPVEATIALSVVFLAWEIAKQDDASLAYRFPVTVSASFGLLHGFGFAAVLRDIGMPQTELPTALLFFNVGVEIGQILFVLALLVAFFALRPGLARLLKTPSDPVTHWESLTVPASYVIGSIASYWMIDRVAGFW
jgi:hypothetical protein